MSVSLSAQATSAGAARRAIWQLLVAEVLIGSVGVFVH
ncbi:EamA/RhaT family transporter, partial [Xanthomonas hortorum pv. vitians]|nr:EamA/RhaT family transporter [Xanthomonas hortorum pv. vitians]